MLTLALALLCVQDPDADTAKKIEELIQSFNDDSLEVRQKAVDDLAKIGKPALAALTKASESADAETKKRALETIDKIHWGRGLAKLTQYVQERYEKDETKAEPLKLKSFQLWFQDTRFYEVAEPAGAAGAMAMMGGAAKNIFAVRKGEDGFVRVMIEGILFADSVTELLAKSDVKLDSAERAFDFATAYLKLSTYGAGSNRVYYSGQSSRFAKCKDGWELGTPMYGTSLVFRTDAGGKLLEIVSRNANWYGREDAEEKSKLELEKLKLELELLRRQLEKK